MLQKPFLLIFLFVFSMVFGGKAQDFTLSKNQAETINSQAADLLKNYETSLNNLGNPLTTVQEKNYFLTDIIENVFEGEDVLIYNDLDPDNLETKDLTAKVYLNNIVTKYYKGIQFIFSDVEVSQPFYLDENSFFIKIELASNLDGTHIDQPINTFQPLDIYVRFTIDELYNISPPRIYSITSHRENLDQFKPVPIDQGENIFNFAFLSPSEGERFRRGKEYRLEWKGNDNNIPVSLELYADTTLINSINPVVVGNHYVWRIPSDMDLGKNYKIKIINLKNKDNTALSPVFSIRRKVPLGLKVLGVAGVAGAVYYILNLDSGTDEKILLPLPPEFP